MYLNNRKQIAFPTNNLQRNGGATDMTSSIHSLRATTTNNNNTYDISPTLMNNPEQKIKDISFLSMWEQRHHRFSQYTIIKNSPFYSICVIGALLAILSTIILMSVVFFVLNDEEVDQFKIGIFSFMFKNTHNDLHLKYSSKSEEKYLKFVVFGDWGRRGHFNQSKVAEQMGLYCKNYGCDFAISTGDNFYQGTSLLINPIYA